MRRNLPKGDFTMAGTKLTCLDCGQVNRVPQERLGSAPKCGTCGAPLMPGKVVEIDPGVLDKASRNDDLPLVVDFWAPWCGPCRQMAPEFAKAAQALQGQARLAKLNTEDHQNISARLGIRGIPTMIAFAGGRELKRQSGAMREAQIVDWVRG
jgi:thioredoxin 2